MSFLGNAFKAVGLGLLGWKAYDVYKENQSSGDSKQDEKDRLLARWCELRDECGSEEAVKIFYKETGIKLKI